MTAVNSFHSKLECPDRQHAGAKKISVCPNLSKNKDANNTPIFWALKYVKISLAQLLLDNLRFWTPPTSTGKESIE